MRILFFHQLNGRLKILQYTIAIPYHRKRSVLKRFILNDCPLSIVMLKNPKNDPDEPLLYFISSLTHKVKITEAYRRRWRIETCFKHLKTQGFNIEDLNRTGAPVQKRREDHVTHCYCCNGLCVIAKRSVWKGLLEAEGVSKWMPLNVHFVLSARHHLFAPSSSVINPIHPLPGIYCPNTFDPTMDVCPVIWNLFASLSTSTKEEEMRLVFARIFALFFPY